MEGCVTNQSLQQANPVFGVDDYCANMNEDSETKLYIVCKKGRLQILKSFLRSSLGDVNEVSGEFQMTPLGVACWEG